MASNKTPIVAKKVKVLAFIKDELGAFGFREYEVNEDQLGAPLDSSLPDIFAIFLMTLQNKVRDIFGV